MCKVVTYLNIRGRNQLQSVLSGKHMHFDLIAISCSEQVSKSKGVWNQTYKTVHN